MNFAGTRMVHANGRNYNVMGSKLYCSSPEDGKILWTAELGVKIKDSSMPAATMPVAAGGKIITCTQDGKIKVFDSKTGSLLQEYKADGIICNQPMVKDGWIYSSTKDGKTVCIDTHDNSLTGWPMWNYNGAHNTMVE